jgi:uncharacterized protein (DUF2062 family)
MIHATRAAVQKWLDVLLHIHDSPQRTAGAYALGVFFGFSPFLGLHTTLALAFAFLLGLNRVAVLVGVYSNLPWFLPPYYTLVTVMGGRLLGRHVPKGLATRLENLFALSFWHADFWRGLYHLLRPFFWPYTVGSLIGAAILAVVAYRLALAFVIARRRHPLHLHLPHHHRPPRPGQRPPDTGA